MFLYECPQDFSTCCVFLSRLEVIFLHGQSFTSKTWEELGTLALLSESGHHAIAIDLPGKNVLLSYLH